MDDDDDDDDAASVGAGAGAAAAVVVLVSRGCEAALLLGGGRVGVEVEVVDAASSWGAKLRDWIRVYSWFMKSLRSTLSASPGGDPGSSQKGKKRKKGVRGGRKKEGKEGGELEEGGGVVVFGCEE